MKDVLYSVLYIFITGCGIALVKYIVELSNSQIDKIQVSIEQYKLNQYIDIAQSALSTAVEATAQTYVDSLKQSGSFTEEAQAIAKDKALSIAKKLLTAEVREAVTTVYGDLDTYLDSMLESMVHKTK